MGLLGRIGVRFKLVFAGEHGIERRDPKSENRAGDDQ